MAHAHSPRRVSRRRFLAVAATLTLCLLVAALLASGWRQLLTPAPGEVAAGEEAPYLGITYVPLSHDLASRYGVEAGAGALVTDVTEGSPAKSAGVRRGDILLSMDLAAFTRPSSLVELMLRRQPGDRVNLRLLRDGKTVDTELVLGARR